MSRTRIKFCGMTRLEDALHAAELGVDAIGLILTARSKRRIGLGQAAAIRSALPPLVSAVALFMDDDEGFVREALAAVRPDMAQFHGSESDAWCAGFGVRYLKAIGMGAGEASLAKLHDYPGASGLLLDGHGLGEAGGGGQRFDWSRMPAGLGKPLVLAGGLHAANVGEAIRLARPWAVDVSSGVESAPGIKNPAQMRAFVEAVRAADAEPGT
jgi:phosphoribosylanthranilate isomerase